LTTLAIVLSSVGLVDRLMAAVEEAGEVLDASIVLLDSVVIESGTSGLVEGSVVDSDIGRMVGARFVVVVTGSLVDKRVDSLDVGLDALLLLIDTEDMTDTIVTISSLPTEEAVVEGKVAGDLALVFSGEEAAANKTSVLPFKTVPNELSGGR
jgi:hypothetical protein